MANVEELRRQAGLSRNALAGLTGVAYQTLFNIERPARKGRRQVPTVETLIRFSRALAPHLGKEPEEVLVELSGINDVQVSPAQPG